MTVTRRSQALFLALAVLAWLSAATAVSAHAELVSSVPAKGSTVPASTSPIELAFSEGMKPSSHADIFAPSGTKLATATLDPADNTKLTYTPTTPLDPGVWTVKWTSVALDGHLLRDQYSFTVSAAATQPPSASATAPTTPTASPTAAASSGPAPSDASATGVGVLLPVLAALIVIAILGLVLLRSRRPASRR